MLAHGACYLLPSAVLVHGYRGADRLDVVLIILGLIGSAANGGHFVQLQTK